MTLSESRWHAINESQYPWEREALDFVRQRLPDHDPYLAWANFEFVSHDGSINEVDLLALSPNGLFLIEIKSRPGTLSGDANTWTWDNEGRIRTEDSPLLLANRKAQKLASLLKSQRAFNQSRPPFVEAAVFLSASSLKVRLDERGRQRVYIRDQPAAEGRPGRPGILALMSEPRAGAERSRIDRPMARAVARALEQIGIRPTQRSRKIGDFVLDKLAFEGPGYQDWDATHVALNNVHRRIRLYPVATGSSALTRRTLQRAAQREYQILEGIRHPGILQAVGFTEHERGPALVFEHDPASMRMDLFLRERGDRMSVDTRLGLIRQIAEALKHAHEKKVYHRALSPQSILIADPDAVAPKIRIFNWQTGRREPGSSGPGGVGGTKTTHLGELVEETARVYMAPEALRDPDADPATMDVFSLGAITYHLFSNRPPGDNVLSMGERLRDERGLLISSVLDGAGPRLAELVFFATSVDVGSRLESIDEFLVHLDAVEEELTAPTREQLPDPIEAKAGDEIDGGFLVEKRLGKGASALALLVKRGDKEYVLKVALGPEQHDRLRAEGEILEKLTHQNICVVHEVLEVGGRVALLMDRAGDQILAQRLRAEGPLHIELLERFGDDLLQTLDWLEQKGIPHRDIKPENIGVAKVGRDSRLTLVLFDFSLSRTSAENIRAGTVPYLDPFLSLRKPPRWDLHAERFAAAMTLYEMATGTLPVWGDGRSDPAMIDDEVTLDTSRFDPDLREALSSFFNRALRRDYRQRFDNSEEMLKAWRNLFKEAERRPVVEPSEDLLLGEAIGAANLDTRLAQLGLGTRALNALDRANVIDVRSLLKLPPLMVNTMRGVGSKTRREITAVAKRLAVRFPDVHAVLPGTESGDSRTKAGSKTSGSDEGHKLGQPEALRRSIDLLADTLLTTGKRASSQQAILSALLNLDEGQNAPAPGLWPGQSDVASAFKLTRARIGQILGQARNQWAVNPGVVELGAEVADMLPIRGGVMTGTELAGALLTTRGSSHPEPRRSRLASAVARAVVEAETVYEAPRFGFWRVGSVVLVARDEGVADYAMRLGKAADRLAIDDPLPTPARVLETLQRIKAPEGDALATTRLVPLAAAVSQSAAVSSRLELYPRGLDALQAIKLAHGALLGAPLLSPEQISERVLGRYPDATRLPARPALDALLAEAGFDLVWDTGANAFLSPAKKLFTSVTPSLPRFPTTLSRATDVTPEVAEARQFQARLQHAFDHGGFLALTVDPRHLQRAERELQDTFALERRSLDAALIGAMKDEAARAGADWGVVRKADASTRDSGDWNNLMLLVRRALPSAERDVLDVTGHLLLVHPGLLGRYSEVEFLGWLREALNRPTKLQSLWILVPADGQSALPMLDGQPIPVITPGQWARIPESWLQNAHKSHVPAA